MLRTPTGLCCRAAPHAHACQRYCAFACSSASRSSQRSDSGHATQILHHRHRFPGATFWHVTDSAPQPLPRPPRRRARHVPLGGRRRVALARRVRPLQLWRRALAAAAVDGMAAAHPQPAFIVLGGDDFGHVPPSREDARAARASHEAMRELLRARFPDVPALPIVGNHDTWPYFSAGTASLSQRTQRCGVTRSARARSGSSRAAGTTPSIRRRRPGCACSRSTTNAFALVSAGWSEQLDWFEEALGAAAAPTAPWSSSATLRPAARTPIGTRSPPSAGPAAAGPPGRDGCTRARGGGGAPPCARSSSATCTRRASACSAPAAAARHGAARPGDEAMPVSDLSPSLTPRNPTPHPPAVRLYALGADGAPVDAWDHAIDLDASNAAGALAWRVSSVREALGLASLGAGAWRWIGALHDDAAFGAHMSGQRCARRGRARLRRVQGERALCDARARGRRVQGVFGRRAPRRPPTRRLGAGDQAEALDTVGLIPTK